MKEQTRYNITPEQGWAKMKPVLDHAMPESKRTKRLAFWWWAASAVIVVGVFGALLMNKSISNQVALTNSTLTTEKSPMLAHDDSNLPIVQDNSLETTNYFDEKEVVNPAMAEDQNETSVENQNSNIVATRTPHALKTSELEIGDEVLHSSSAVALTEADADLIPSENGNAIETIGTEDFLINETAVNIDDSESFVSSQRGLVSLSPLDVLPMPMITKLENNRQVIFSEEHTKSKRNPSWFSPAISASGLVGQNGGIGVYGGAGVDVNLSRKFSLTTAIGYSVYNPNANLFGSSLDKLSFNEQSTIINSDPFSGLDNYVYSESINVEADYSAISPLVETVSQWQIDIGLNWRFSRRFYALGGVKFGFKTEALSQYPIVRGDPSGMPGLPQIRLGNSLSDFDVIRNSSTSMFVGFGYRISRHFDVIANWTHGFDQYVLNAENVYTADLAPAERTDYIRGLALGLKYTL